MTNVQVPLASDRIYKVEATLLKKTMEWLAPQERSGIKAIRINDRFNKGYSDLFICVNGWFVVAELKDDSGVSTPHQELFIKQMKAAGAIGGVCRTVRDVSDLVDLAKQLTKDTSKPLQ